MVLQRFRIDFIYGWQIQAQQSDAVFLQPRRHIGGNHWNLVWENRRVTPSPSFYKEPRGRRYCFGGRPEVLDGDQVFFLRIQESLRKIDHGRAAQISLERRFSIDSPSVSK